MNAFWGMDTEAARGHAQKVAGAGTSLQDLHGSLAAAISAVAWTGADAESFREAWATGAGTRLAELASTLEVTAKGLEAQAEEQDQVSGPDGADERSDPGECRGPQSSIPDAPGDGGDQGYRHHDNPFVPNWLEDPIEQAFSDAAGTASDLIGRGVDEVMDGAVTLGDRMGLETGGLEQLHRDADHLGSMLTDLATGERVPAIAELASSSIVTALSAGTAGYELITGEDTPFMDDRPGGIVHDVATTDGPQRGPQSLQDLIVDNNRLRLANPEGRPLEAGQIGVQQVRRADGSEAYIVQIPPTEGARMTSSPDAWGGQGNARDWGSNLRLVAGQHPASMDDVQAAMDAAGIPQGSDVMLVGHSQGGIIADHLAADPSFNNCSGGPGSYNITHVFTVGAPGQTVVPAQDGTQSVNVAHQAGLSPGGISGDGISMLDLGGRQVTGGQLSAPNQHEVALPGYPTASLNPKTILENNHDSVGPADEPYLGYSGSLARHTSSDPTLSALQRDLNGAYIGPGTQVTRNTVVTVGREDRA